MSSRATTDPLRSAAGFGLIEVLVSALLVVVVALAVFTGFSSASRASGRTRAQVVAGNLAQQDQERMRAMRPSELVGYTRTTTVAEGPVTYTVKSTGTYALAPSKRSGCTSGRKDEYLKIVSTVSFPSQDNLRPVRLESLVAPPQDAASPGQGSMLLQIVKADGITGTDGTAVNVVGPRADAQTTAGEGCVFFANFPVGAYTLSYNRTGYVDPSGVQAISFPGSIADQQTTSLARQYDRAGSVNATFWTYGSGAYAATTGTVVQAYHPGVPVRSGYTTTTSGTPASSLTIASLFPFTSAYTVMSGSCATNAIPAGALRTQLEADGYSPSVTVPAGSSVAAKVFEPAINPTLRYQTGTSNGVPVFSARAGNIVVTGAAACPSTTTVPTQATPVGTLAVAERGFPYGTYTVCGEVQSGGVWRRKTVTGVTTSALETPVALDVLSDSASRGRC